MRKHIARKGKEHVRQTLRDQLMQREEVLFAYLFGSFTLEGSFDDVDVAVYVTPEALHRTDALRLSFSLADILERAVGLPVDVVILNTAPLSLQ
ncbi:MAG: nucleotidyltransferase domain-containing protein [Armatimonadota bacterium]|nr:nucleotidyltransferase domain-containing protein [bacterium]MDW8320132.1 nucleotidyltransferase domain-containing protein [Armatimonadota bacterium]